MSIAKRRRAAGERIVVEPGHGGMYRLGGSGWCLCGQGPAPFWRPTREVLVHARIDPAAWCRGLRDGTGLDLAVEVLGETSEPTVVVPTFQGSQLSLF